MSKNRNLVSHVAVAGIAALAGAALTYVVLTGQTQLLTLANAQTPTPGQKSTEVITQPMPDIAREMRISLTERDPGNGSAPHRHPGQHTFGYILEGTYDVQVNDGPVRHLKAGDVFYEPPGALHAVSRNPSPDKPLKYLIIQVGDPTKPRIVPEK